MNSNNSNSSGSLKYTSGNRLGDIVAESVITTTLSAVLMMLSRSWITLLPSIKGYGIIEPMLAVLAGIVATLMTSARTKTGKQRRWVGPALCTLSVMGILLCTFILPGSGGFEWLKAKNTFADGIEANIVLLIYGMAVIFFASVVVCCVIRLLHNTLWGRCVIAAAIAVSLIASMVNGMVMARLPLMLLIAYALLVVIQLSELISARRSSKALGKKRRISNANTARGLSYMPICVIVALASVLLPSSPRPIDWGDTIESGVQHTIVRASIFMSEKGIGEPAFPMRLSGVADTSVSLGGSCTTLGINNLRVTTKSGVRSGQYLAGIVYSDYTGRGWTAAEQQTDNAPNTNLVELGHAISASRSGRALAPYMIRSSVIVTNAATRSGIVFHPAYTSEVLCDVDTITVSPAYMRLSELREFDSDYHVGYLTLDPRNTVFTGVVRSLDGFSYADSAPVDRSTSASDLPTSFSRLGITKDVYDSDYYSYMSSRAESIKETYTQLPDELPERVYELARSFAGDESDTDYDRVKRIESYMKIFPYSKNTGAAPAGKDFVDWFLFEKQTGYCTYYASAMTVLTRCLGIPARYVEGYIWRAANTAKNYLVYDVTDRSAHAWTEVYFEGVGWVRFEPTGTYTGSTSVSTGGGSGAGAGESDGDYQFVYSGSPDDYYEIISFSDTPEEESVSSGDASDSDVSSGDAYGLNSLNGRNDRAMAITGIVSLAALGLLIIIFLLRPFAGSALWMRRMTYDKGLSGRSMEVYRTVLGMLLTLSVAGIGRSEGETLIEYGERLSKDIRFSEGVRSGLPGAMETVGAIRYGGESIGSKEAIRLRRLKRKLTKEAWKAVGYGKMALAHLIYRY